MFLTYVLIVIAGARLTFEDSNKPKSVLGVDSKVAKCAAICATDHYCFFFGIDEIGICQTFKTFDSEVEYRLYARKPAVTINVTSYPFGSVTPASIELVEKGTLITSTGRGVTTVELDPLLNKFENQRRADVYSTGTQFLDYLNRVVNGTIILGATYDDATGSLDKDYMKIHGFNLSTIRFRQPYAFLMQKGYPNKTILVIKPSDTGRLELIARIYRPCLTTDPTHYVFAHGHDLDEV